MSLFSASAECYATYLHVSAGTLEARDATFAHQHVVDAYAAQHPLPPTKPIAVWFGLLGLHLLIDEGFTGREIQQAHSRIAQRQRIWPRLSDTPNLAGMCVAELRTTVERSAADVTNWATFVWSCWASQQAQVREVARRLLH